MFVRRQLSKRVYPLNKEHVKHTVKLQDVYTRVSMVELV